MPGQPAPAPSAALAAQFYSPRDPSCSEVCSIAATQDSERFGAGIPGALVLPLAPGSPVPQHLQGEVLSGTEIEESRNETQISC